MSTVYVVEITAYDLRTNGATTLRYSSGLGYTSTSGSTPAHTWFEPRIVQPGAIRRGLEGNGLIFGRANVSYGDLVLANGDGGLDAFKDYALDSRDVVLYRGEDTGDFPGDFTKLYAATAEDVQVGRDDVTIKLRDRHVDLDVPLQTERYKGNNVPPGGVEGLADFTDHPKPLAYGKVKNVRPPMVNTSKLIYQVHDGPIFTINTVYDRGVRVGGGEFEEKGLSTAFATAAVRWVCEDEEQTILVAGGDASIGCVIDYSTDGGETWQASDVGNFSAGTFLQGVAYGNGKYVTLPSGSTSAFEIYTADSPTGPWTATDVSGTVVSDNPIALTFANGYFFASYFDKRTFISSDGVSWSALSSLDGLCSAGAADGYVANIQYGNNVWVAVGRSGGGASSRAHAHYSHDVSNWTTALSQSGSAALTIGFYRLVYGGGRFLAVGLDGYMARSLDGDTWEFGIAEPFGSTDDLQAGAYGDGRFLVAGVAAASVFQSEDSYDWRSVTDAFTAGNINYGIWSSGAQAFVFVGDYAKVYIDTGDVIAGYSSVASLLSDDYEPAPGEALSYPSGGYVRLGGSPAGEVTADFQQASSMTAYDLFTAITSTAVQAGYNSTDMSALQTYTEELGYWTITEGETIANVCDLLAYTVGGWWGSDRLGQLTLKRALGPNGAPVASFTEHDMLSALTRITPRNYLPVWRSVVRWGRNYTVQADVAGAAVPAHRAEVGTEWRQAVATDTAVRTRHLLARQVEEDTLLTTAADAQAEATRRQGLRGLPWDLFEFTVPLDDDTQTLDLGDTVRLTHPRYDLENGKDGVIVDLEQNLATEQIRLRARVLAFNQGRMTCAPTLAGTGTVT